MVLRAPGMPVARPNVKAEAAIELGLRDPRLRETLNRCKFSLGGSLSREFCSRRIASRVRTRSRPGAGGALAVALAFAVRRQRERFRRVI